jgi:hypothetical protein
MADARVIGIISGTPEQPRIAYLKEDALLRPGQLPDTGGLDPTEVFRFGARCEEGRCAQFEGGKCSLGHRIVQGTDPVVDALPPCTLRASCRWFAEQGEPACLRCPQVVTLLPRGDDQLSRAAALPESG